MTGIRSATGSRVNPAPGSADVDDLRAFGYEQLLDRRIGPFSSFALAFSLISVFTGVFANFGHAVRHVGGAVVWPWLVVLAGQLLVAAVLARLSARMPLSGYGYQWTSRLVNPHYGFFVGWLLVLQFLCGFPGICATLAAELGAVVGDGWARPESRTALTLAIICLAAVIHLSGIRPAAAINDLGVWAELAGVVAVSALLIAVAIGRGADPTVLGAGLTAVGGRPTGPADWASSLLLGAWCLTGFEAAADLAEETRQPRRVVPRAMVTALVAAGVAGAALLAGLVLAAPDLEAVRADPRPIVPILESALGTPAALSILAVAGVSVFACAIASMAGASRLLFAMARDRMLPGAAWLAAVESRRRCPRNAILLVWGVSSLVVLALPSLDVITQISAVAGYLGYAGIVAAAGWGAAAAGAGGGRLARVTACLALAWVGLVVGCLTIPPLAIDGVATRHLPAISSALGLLAGAGVYAGWIRGRIVAGGAGPHRGPPVR